MEKDYKTLDTITRDILERPKQVSDEVFEILTDHYHKNKDKLPKEHENQEDLQKTEKFGEDLVTLATDYFSQLAIDGKIKDNPDGRELRENLFQTYAKTSTFDFKDELIKAKKINARSVYNLVEEVAKTTQKKETELTQMRLATEPIDLETIKSYTEHLGKETGYTPVGLDKAEKKEQVAPILLDLIMRVPDRVLEYLNKPEEKPEEKKKPKPKKKSKK